MGQQCIACSLRNYVRIDNNKTFCIIVCTILSLPNVYGLLCGYLDFWDMLVSYHVFMPELCSGVFKIFSLMICLEL